MKKMQFLFFNEKYAWIMLLIRLYFHNVPSFMLFHANNTLSTLCTHKTTTPRILWCFSLFSQKTSMTPCFHKDFWEIKVLIQKQKSNWCLFRQTSSKNSSDILTPIKNLKDNPNTMG